MEDIILYASRYGTARRYAEALSAQSGLPALRAADAPPLADKRTIVYLGGLYADNVLGLRKAMRGLSLQDGQRLMLVTVGLTDPDAPGAKESIRDSLRRQLPAALFDRAELYHLRGGIDYAALSMGHRALMALMHRSLRGTPPERWTAQDRAVLETYGKQVDFTDFRALAPILAQLRR